MAIFSGLGDNNQDQKPQNGRVKSVLRYTMMPEILPRIRALGFHFGHFAYLLALVFSSARLIPQNHPVLNAANIGRYSIRQVIAMAANNITWSKNNIDQIAIFSAIVIGLIMIVIQGVLIAIAALVGMNPAQAQVDAASFFETPTPDTDLAMTFLALVFGELPNGAGESFWGNGVTMPAFNTPIHTAIYQMLSLYSMAMMVIAVIIVLYYIMTVVGEAAKTGTPFGDRFNSLWAPIRLVVALGLLVPLGSGLNSAQYITLWMAKMGSGLGTQVWLILSDSLNDSEVKNYHINDFNNIWLTEIGKNILLAEVCTSAYNLHDPSYNFTHSTDINDLGNDLTMTWRAENGNSLPTYRRSCGELNVRIPQFLNSDGDPIVPADQLVDTTRESVERIRVRAEEIASIYVPNKIPGETSSNPDYTAEQALADITLFSGDESTVLKQNLEQIYANEVDTNVDEMIAEQRLQGWVGAGIWYMNLARIIQTTEGPKTDISPEFNLPEGQFERGDVANNGGQNRRLEREIGNSLVHVDEAKGEIEEGFDTFVESLPEGERETFLMRLSESFTARRVVLNMLPGGAALNAGVDWVDQTYFNEEFCMDLNLDSDGLDRVQCIIYNIITPEELIFLRSERNEAINLDPMSALNLAGHGIVSKSWKFVIAGFIGQTLGGVPFVGDVVGAIGGLLIFIGLLGLTAGLILYFLLPLLPFIYFFFAVISWLLEIFEAIVAMPLWALSHLRIDGPGFPGQGAMSGYFLLLAILLRPALIVFGLIGGYIIFSAAIYILQFVFNPLLSVVNQDTSKGLELLIYSLIFAVMCYQIGLMCFKMVDLLPNQILRWLNAGVSTFSDNKPDPVGDNNALLTGVVGAISANGALQNIGSGIGNSYKGAFAGRGGPPNDPNPPTGEGGNPNQPQPPEQGGGGSRGNDTTNNVGVTGYNQNPARPMDGVAGGGGRPRGNDTDNGVVGSWGKQNIGPRDPNDNK